MGALDLRSFLFHTVDRSSLVYRVGFPIMIQNVTQMAAQRANLLDSKAHPTGTLPPQRIPPETEVRISGLERLFGEWQKRQGWFSVRDWARLYVGQYEITGPPEPLTIGASLISSGETSLNAVEKLKFPEQVTVAASTIILKTDRPLWGWFAHGGNGLFCCLNGGTSRSGPQESSHDAQLRSSTGIMPWIVVVGMVPAAVAQEKPLTVESSTMQPSVIIGRPMLTWWDVKFRGCRIAHGTVPTSSPSQDSGVLATVETEELDSLNGPDQRIRVMLPAIDPGFAPGPIGTWTSVFGGRSFPESCPSRFCEFRFRQKKFSWFWRVNRETVEVERPAIR